MGLILIFAGVVLAGAALLLWQKNRRQDAAAGAAAARVVQQLQTAPTMQPHPADNAPEQTEEIDGNAYLGVLEIPAIGLALPVMADWDYTRLKTAPCRQYGSVQTNDLVIAGHNYQTHFGRLEQLQAGNAVTFTDISGATTLYRVALTGIVQPEETAAVQTSGYPLVLYTCTYSGKSRLAVFCEKTE